MSTININVSKTDMGLDQVDNTSDLNKPISTATQTALNLKVDKVTGSRLITSAEGTKLSNLSGTNTGDQDLSGYQPLLSGGTTNRLTKWSSSSAITSSLIQDNGTTLSIGTTPVANNLFKVSSNATDTTLVSENSQASGVGISGSSSGSNGVGGSFTSTSVTGVKIGVNASATGAGGTNKGAVFGATNGVTNYAIQLTDGTEGSGKFLKSVTANGEANWVSIANTDVSGLGTLSTQSGTFSGTSSGTNTGDQVISDATITTTDITTNNFTTAKHGFVPKGTNVGNYLKDDGTWGAISAGGLTYFTEAQSTTAPNATVNVDSLTAVASTTNADFAVRPKGNGAILANIPDNTTTGGNKRGQNSVDLQMYRDNANHVASGYQSVISGGWNNRASGDQSVSVGGYRNHATNSQSSALGGNQNTASGVYAVTVGGSTNIASGNLSFACGNSNTSAGGGSVTFGGSNVANANWSFAFGNANQVDGLYSQVRGVYGNDFGVYGRFIYSMNNTTLGDSQNSKLILNKRTTDATATVLSVQGATVSATSQLVLSNNSVYRVKGSIVGKKSGSTDVAVWDIDCVIVRGTTAASTVLVGSANVNVVTNIPAWGTPTITANTTLGCVTVTVIGLGATNIQWTCVLETTEVIYA